MDFFTSFNEYVDMDSDEEERGELEPGCVDHSQLNNALEPVIRTCLPSFNSPPRSRPSNPLLRLLLDGREEEDDVGSVDMADFYDEDEQELDEFCIGEGGEGDGGSPGEGGVDLGGSPKIYTRKRRLSTESRNSFCSMGSINSGESRDSADMTCRNFSGGQLFVAVPPSACVVPLQLPRAIALVTPPAPLQDSPSESAEEGRRESSGGRNKESGVGGASTASKRETVSVRVESSNKHASSNSSSSSSSNSSSSRRGGFAKRHRSLWAQESVNGESEL